jgi:hypothetical protein
MAMQMTQAQPRAVHEVVSAAPSCVVMTSANSADSLAAPSGLTAKVRKRLPQADAAGGSCQHQRTHDRFDDPALALG